MNALLWILQILGALVFGMSGMMGAAKVFSRDDVNADLPTLRVLPLQAWRALAILQLSCAIGLVVPAAFHWRPQVTVLAASVLVGVCSISIWAHAKHREIPAIVFGVVLGLMMAFVAYGRECLEPFP